MELQLPVWRTMTQWSNLDYTVKGQLKPAWCRPSFGPDWLRFDLWSRLQLMDGKIRRGANTMWEFMRVDGSLLLTANCSYWWYIYLFLTLLPVWVSYSVFILWPIFFCFLHELVVVFIEVLLFFCSVAPYFAAQHISTVAVILLQTKYEVTFCGVVYLFIMEFFFFNVSSTFSCIFFIVYTQCLATWVSWNQRYSK